MLCTRGQQESAGKPTRRHGEKQPRSAARGTTEKDRIEDWKPDRGRIYRRWERRPDGRQEAFREEECRRETGRRQEARRKDVGRTVWKDR